MADHRVKYVLAVTLVDELVEAADEGVVSTTIARHGRGDLLCLDELRHMELDRRGDRLSSGGNIIETGTTSYRPARAGAQRASRAEP